jgi:hypothetical protein
MNKLFDDYKNALEFAKSAITKLDIAKQAFESSLTAWQHEQTAMNHSVCDLLKGYNEDKRKDKTGA